MLTVDPVTFAKRILDARKKAELTQKQLAEACGISDRTVSAWENGVAEGILADHLFCVADKLSVDPRWLATGESKDSEARAEILSGLDALPEDQQLAVLALVRSLKR